MMMYFDLTRFLAGAASVFGSIVFILESHSSSHWISKQRKNINAVKSSTGPDGIRVREKQVRAASRLRGTNVGPNRRIQAGAPLQLINVTLIAIDRERENPVAE